MKTSRKKDAAYYIKAIIGIAIMLFFGLIPAPAPITQTGMILLGQFIGLIFLWSAVDMVWPTFLAIACFGFIATDIYPGSFALAGVYEAGMQSLGNWCVIIVFGLLLICDVLGETGIIRRLALWFLTRKIAKNSPWGFVFMFLLASLVIGLFMDPTPSQLLMYALATEIFEIAGIEKEDKLAKVISVGVAVSVIVAFAATPICHSMPILFMGIYSAIAGVSVNWVSYMAIVLPVAIVIWILVFFFFKLFTKTDVSKLEKLDFAKIEALKSGPMSPKEIFVLIVSLILVVVWILPGFLSILAPSSPIYLFLDGATMYTPLLIAIVLFAIVRFAGKPVLNIGESCRRINWDVILLLAGIMMIASAMGEDTTGIAAWVMEIVAPIVSGLSPMVLIILLCIISVILTNIANNIPVGIVLVTVSIPLCMEMGINPFVAAVAISYCANLAYVIPPAFVPVATCYAYPYGGGKYMFRWGLVASAISIVITAVMIYPLGLIFG